jgi:malonate-semialdehyde dehydrogenase (acetylating)/methylmalonate-semialdehyde dehydrogenase
MDRQINHWIDGKIKISNSGRYGDVFDPSTGIVQAKVALASASEVDEAVKNSNEAFKTWSKTPPLKRARVMFKFRELLETKMKELAKIVTSEHGKILSDAEGSITRGMEVVEFAAGIPHLLKGEYTEQVGNGIDSWSTRQPLGVCAGITPFNFPAMVPMWMFPVAIACGNTFVLKPSERDPSFAIKMAELLKEAGLPDGVFNVLNGDKEAVDALIHHDDVIAVSFVGSTPVAEYIYKTGTANNKRVQALGGAKNHMVVMPDANMDQATDALMGAAYGSAGERCMAVSVAVAVGDAGDKLIEKLSPRVRALKIGPGTDPDSEMGPLITDTHKDKVENFISKGIEEGATLIVDGRGLNLQGYENGFYTGGTLFDNVTSEMSIYREEIFGPVLSVVRTKDYAEAVKLVNEHEFGNGAAIFTQDGDVAREFSNQVKIGMVGVNVPIPVPLAFHSFGGWKRSMFGDHHMHGAEGVRFYTRYKVVTSRWPTGIRAGADFVIPTMT